MISTYINNRWFKVFTMVLLVLFSVNTLAWAHPLHRMNLSAQSVFNPVTGNNIIRDRVIIKYYLVSLSKVFDTPGDIPSDVDIRIDIENIDVKLGFRSIKDKEFAGLLNDPGKEFLIPCRINGGKYYAYVTDWDDSGYPEKL